MKYVILLLGLAMPLATADTVTLHPDADTALFQNDPNNNFGAALDLPAGTTRAAKKSRILLQFGVAAAIPSNAVISSVVLTLTVVKTPSAPVNSRFDLHRVLLPWAEGTNSADRRGSVATTGETSWNNRLAPSTPWSAPGGALGVDYSTNISGSTQVARLGSYAFVSTSNLVQDVQDWLVGSATNAGWVLMTANESIGSTARRFASRESGKNSPALVVTYSVPQPATAPELQVTGFTRDTFSFGFTTTPNQAYVVEFKDTLEQTAWQTLTNITASTSSQSITLSDSLAASPQRFYRTRTP